MYILGIESSCDETAAAIVEDGKHLISNVISTSGKEQALYGGVVPEIASRRHAEYISATVQQALQDALDGWSREQDARAAGELLFAAANAMRLAGVDAEEALTFASKRFCAGLLEQEPQSGTQVE